MFGDNAQRTMRFADLHAANFSGADRIEQHDDLAAVAEDVNVRPVPALPTQVHENLKPVDFDFRRIPNLFGLERRALQPRHPKRKTVSSCHGGPWQRTLSFKRCRGSFKSASPFCSANAGLAHQ